MFFQWRYFISQKYNKSHLEIAIIFFWFMEYHHNWIIINMCNMVVM